MVENIGQFIKDNKKLYQVVQQLIEQRNRLLDNEDFKISRNPKNVFAS